MPRPVESGRRYVPGLDGIRALAVLCVIAYHLNVPWARGGMLGVGVFFTLSGYLITDLLLGHWYRHANLGLRTFWLHRARRLLPALFLMLTVVSLWVAIFDTSQLADVRRQVISSALYFANWSTIAAHGSYFSRFAAPLPLDHVWSLAIEEQFYLAWPWLLGLGIILLRSRLALALLTLVGAAGSAYLMSHLYHPGFDPTRVYEGTDTRASGLLIGAALAMLWPSDFPRRRGRWALRHPLGLDLIGIVGIVGILVLVWKTDAFDPFIYPTGFILLSAATAAIVFAVVNPTSVLGPMLGCAPLRWIGVRSYGIYLWQWPIVVLWGAPRVGVNWPQAALQVAVTFVVAALSWRLLEEPIRHGALGRLWRRGGTGFADFGVRRRRLALSAGTVCAVGVATVGLSGVLPGRLGRPRLSGEPDVAAPEAHSGGGSRSAERPRGRQAGQASHPHVLSLGRIHRRLDVGGTGFHQLHPEPAAPSAGAVDQGGSQDGASGDLWSAVDRRDLQGQSQRRHSCSAVRLAGFPGLLDPGRGDQRCRQRAGRLAGRPAFPDREDDVDHREAAGPVGRRGDAGGARAALRRGSDAKVER